MQSFVEIGKAEVIKPVRGIDDEKNNRKVSFCLISPSGLAENFIPSLFSLSIRQTVCQVSSKSVQFSERHTQNVFYGYYNIVVKPMDSDLLN